MSVVDNLSHNLRSPDHVPADRIFDFDIYNPAVENGEYQLAFKALYEPNIPDVFWTPRNGGHWVVTRSVLMRKVLSDADNFSSRSIVVPKEANANPPLKPIQSDPPEHAKYRALIARTLSPNAIMPMENDVRQLAIQLIDGFKARGECEFVTEFAYHLPIAIFMKLVSLPEVDSAELREIVCAASFAKKPEVRIENIGRLYAYSMQKVRERRAKPGNDLISSIVMSEIDGQPIDDDSVNGMIVLLLLAGLDTVASMLGFFAYFLARNDGHRKQLQSEPAIIPKAVEEMLRRFPIALLGREVAKNVELDGILLHKGDQIVVPTMLGGLDDRRFEAADEVDFNRKNPIHATFGAGTHRCMGAMLARMELRIFLEEWLRRIPDFKVKPDAQMTVHAGIVGTMTSLPLVWSVQESRT
jgi:cytochrome P450